MNVDFIVLAGRISQELADLEQVISRAEKASRASSSNMLIPICTLTLLP